MPRLYELTNEYESILAEVEFLDGELPPDLAERLDAVNQAIEDKVEQCIVVMREADAQADKFNREVRRMQTRVRQAKSLSEFLENYLLRCMHLQGRKDMQAGMFTLKAQASPPRVVVDDMAAVPVSFDKRRERELSLSEIKSVLTSGGVVPGVHLEQGEHLRIV